MSASDRDFPAAGFYGPGIAGKAMLNWKTEIVECDGGANVAGNAVKDIADIPIRGVGSLEDEMLFAMHDRGGVRKVQELDAGLGILRRDGFVAKIDAQAIWRRFANDTSEDECRNVELQIGKLLITKIPKNIRTGAAFAIVMAGVKAKSGGAAGDRVRDGHSGLNDASAKLIQGFVELLELRFAARKVGVVNMTIVGVETGNLQPGQGGDQAVEIERLVIGNDTGAVHPAIQVEKY